MRSSRVFSANKGSLKVTEFKGYVAAVPRWLCFVADDNLISHLSVQASGKKRETDRKGRAV